MANVKQVSPDLHYFLLSMREKVLEDKDYHSKISPEALRMLELPLCQMTWKQVQMLLEVSLQYSNDLVQSAIDSGAPEGTGEFQPIYLEYFKKTS